MIRRPPRSTLFPTRRSSDLPEYLDIVRKAKQYIRAGDIFQVVLSQRFSVKAQSRSEEHTSELQSRLHLVCRLLLDKKKSSRLTKAGAARHVLVRARQLHQYE